MAQNPQIKQFSSSWIGWSPSASSDNIFQQMALQGQSFFVSSGDYDSLFNGLTDSGEAYYWPADDPYITSVGGTSLTMNGSGASYASEIVWNNGFFQFPGFDGQGAGGSSGGISSYYAIPIWQRGLDMSANRGSKTMRNFPDVAMPADNIEDVWHGSQCSVGGTSCSAPLWAGFMALVNQEAAAQGQPPVGFLNPVLYALGQSADYTNSFHDITVGNNATETSGGLFPAVPGYDLCTGWGTPNGSNLIYALALPEPLVIAPNTNLLFTGPVGGPFTPSAVTYSLTNRNGTLNWSLALDAAWLDVSPTNGTLIAGGSNTVVAVTPNLLATNLSAGSYTANLFFTNLNDQSVQSRQITLAVFATPLITSQPTNQAVLEGMTATFSVGTASNALLYYQWQFDNGGGPTNLTDTGGITGSATSSLTISNVSPANVGAYSVIVSNAAGSVPSADASLTVLTGQTPVILSQPAGQTVLPGATATFSVGAAGDQPLAYCWLLNGMNLTDAGSLHGSATSTLTISNALAANFGNYSVLITNSFGSITSAVAVLSVTGVTSSGVTLETLYSFTTNSIGCSPLAGLIQATDGNFYGTAAGGGSHGYGTVFRMDANDVVTLVYAFRNLSDGGFPVGALVQGTNGLLYGTACYGGSTYAGTVFRMTTNGVTIGYSLTSASSGLQPEAGLVQGRDGNFYGTAEWCGVYTYGDGPLGYGTVFKLTPGGALTGLASFNSDDGAHPASTLLQAADGNFYGVTLFGGTNGARGSGWGIGWDSGLGTIFRITPTGTLTSLFSFGNTNGSNPIGGLVQDTDGTFYGTTYAGGAHNAGTVFKLTPDGTFSSLYSFTGGNDGGNAGGSWPSYGGRLLAIGGNLYGTTCYGGVYGLGTVFRISPNGILVTLVNFDGYQGAYPEGTLIQGTDGKLYGTTLYGGASGFGAIYRLSIDSPLQITHQPQPQTAFAGDSVTFSVATFGSLPVSYQWQKDGTNLVDGGNLAGSNARVLSLTNIGVADAALYSVVVSNAYGTVSSTGARLEIIFSPPYILSGPDDQTVLAGTTASFSVEVEGDGPLSFQWQRNGTNLVDAGNVSGSTTPTLTLASVNIAGRPYITNESLAEFYRRAATGEFAKPPVGAARKSAEARAEKEASE